MYRRSSTTQGGTATARPAQGRTNSPARRAPPSSGATGSRTTTPGLSALHRTRNRSTRSAFSSRERMGGGTTAGPLAAHGSWTQALALDDGKLATTKSPLSRWTPAKGSFAFIDEHQLRQQRTGGEDRRRTRRTPRRKSSSTRRAPPTTTFVDVVADDDETAPPADERDRRPQCAITTSVAIGQTQGARESRRR